MYNCTYNFSHANVTDEYAKALPLLSALVQTNKYSQAGVWLKYAECQHMLNDLEAAAASYSKVITLAPNHTDTRYVYSMKNDNMAIVSFSLFSLLP